MPLSHSRPSRSLSPSAASEAAAAFPAIVLFCISRPKLPDYFRSYSPFMDDRLEPPETEFEIFLGIKVDGKSSIIF